LGHAISPRAWTSRFPWLAIGATVVGVFSLAVALQNRLARRAAARSRAEMYAAEARLGAARYAPRRSSHKAARLARGFLRRMVVGPLRAALMAQLRGMF
ncbi:MAG TPA: hypothetical protein VHY20_03765, partial [Pirellulales bacterium]|nr:hypothetical protein [Pirellulales bacterium]